MQRIDTVRATRFRDRREGGRVLAGELSDYADRDDVVVLALPRGGIPVGYEVALALDAPLDVFVVRKLGVPGYPELAMGAIATGGAIVLDKHLIPELRISPSDVDRTIEEELAELERRERVYRGERAPPKLEGKTVILVDDGLATGASMRAAALAARKHEPEAVVIAVPVAATQSCEEFRDEADDVVCARTPEPFYAVGLWYEDFSQTGDEEVRELLARSLRVENNGSR